MTSLEVAIQKRAKEHVNRAAILIDGPSLRFLEKRTGKRFAYEALRRYVEKKFGVRVRHMHYFTSLLTRPDEPTPVDRLLRWLVNNEFLVHTTYLHELVNDEGRPVTRGTIATRIVAHGIELTDSVDELFVISGDGNLVPLVEVAQRRDVPVSILSITTIERGFVSRDLSAIADRVVDVEQALFVERVEK